MYKLLAVYLTAFMLLSVLAFSQQQTETHCTTIGDSMDCRSTTTDTAAQQKANEEFGKTMGYALVSPIVNHRIKKYCKAHPGEPFHWTMADGTVVRRGTCPAKDH